MSDAVTVGGCVHCNEAAAAAVVVIVVLFCRHCVVTVPAVLVSSSRVRISAKSQSAAARIC